MHRRDLLRISSLILGTGISASVARAVLAAEPINPGNAALIFNVEQEKIIAILSEMIIPTTDSPGAVKAGVPQFIGTMVSDWYDDLERGVFFQGFNDLDHFCQERDSVGFLDAKEETQTQALKFLEQQSMQFLKENSDPDANPFFGKPDPRVPFFSKLKELVVIGFYTSEIGAKEELVYQPMPGYYDGDFDYAKVGRRWTS